MAEGKKTDCRAISEAAKKTIFKSAGKSQLIVNITFNAKGFSRPGIESTDGSNCKNGFLRGVLIAYCAMMKSRLSSKRQMRSRIETSPTKNTGKTHLKVKFIIS